MDQGISIFFFYVFSYFFYFLSYSMILLISFPVHLSQSFLSIFAEIFLSPKELPVFYLFPFPGRNLFCFWKSISESISVS